MINSLQKVPSQPAGRHRLQVSAAMVAVLFTGRANAVGVYYADPGWAYAYDGDEAYYNDPDGPNSDYIGGDATNWPGGRGGTAALEFPGFVDPQCNSATTVCAVDNDNATWIHNGSQWDGTAPGDALGGNPGDPVPIPPAAPGGVATYTIDGTSFLRLQDPGNPQSWGWADKNAQANLNSARQEGNNRRIQFSHPIERDADYSGNAAVIDNGITISLRARLATAAAGPLDDYYDEDGPASGPPLPWPTDGKGYTVSGNGRGMFMITQSGANGPGQLAFSLFDANTIADERLLSPTVTKTGLVFNNRANALSVNTNDATADTLNIVEIPNDELTEWHEFWITVQALPTPIDNNTHEVNIFHNGSLVPQTFQTVLGRENEFGAGPHLGIGLSSESRWGAYDVDYFAYKQGVIVPQLAAPRLAGDYNGDGSVDAADYTTWRDQLGSDVALLNETATLGSVTIEDYDVWKGNFGTSGAGGSAVAAPVPEPSSILLLLCAPAFVFCSRPTGGNRWGPFSV